MRTNYSLLHQAFTQPKAFVPRYIRDVKKTTNIQSLFHDTMPTRLLAAALLSSVHKRVTASYKPEFLRAFSVSTYLSVIDSKSTEY